MTHDLSIWIIGGICLAMILIMIAVAIVGANHKGNDYD